MLFAGLGFILVLIAPLLSRASQTDAFVGINAFAGACAAASLATGIHAQVSQLRCRSRRVRRKVLMGIPVALCTALAVLANVRGHYAPTIKEDAPRVPVQTAKRDSEPEDNSLIKPGWHGELLSSGVLLVITSFEDNASESRRFNRGLFKPVSYATLSVINTGSTSPAVLASPEVTLHLDSGEKTTSLPVRELLSHSTGKDETLLKRLADQQLIPVGGMIPDIPLCVNTPFDWKHVVAVEVSLGAGSVLVPGRLMTAAEKQAVLFRNETKSPPAMTNGAAEKWYKDL